MTNHIAALLLPLVLTLPDQSATNYPLSCNGTSPTSDIGELRVYRSIGGQPFTLYLTKDVRGREGLRDTSFVDTGPGARFYATVADTFGNTSCPSSVLALPAGQQDTVAVAADQVVEIRRYDVHGRLVVSRSRPARGVYWEISRFLSGRTMTRRIVLLR